MKSLLAFLFLFLYVNTFGQELTLHEKITNLKQENQQLLEMQKRLSETTISFEEVKKNTDHVFEKSSQNLRENMIRVIASGLKDMFESTVETSTNWVAGVTIIAMKVVSYYRDQWMGNQVKSDYHNEKLNLEGVAQNMQVLADNNNEVYRKVSVMDYCVRLPLEYYDDDNRELIRLFPEVEQYWKDADGTTDDDTEKSTRKLNILRNTSKKASEQLRVEIDKMKADSEKIKQQVSANNQRINELSRKINTWNANLEQPDKIDYSDEINQPEPVSNASDVGWNDCLAEQLSEGGFVDERDQRNEEWEKRMKEYHQKGYRFATRIDGLEFPEKIIYGEKFKYSYKLSHPELDAPGVLYKYNVKVTVNGKNVDFRNSKSYQPGTNTVLFTLTSCNKLVDKLETTTTLVHPIDEVEVYWEDPISEVAFKKPVSFMPKIHHPTLSTPKQNLNYYFKYIFDDVEQDSRNNFKFTPHLSLLTPGKHEVTIQLYNGFTNELADQYLHHLTVLEAPEGAATTMATKPNLPVGNQPDYRNMEGKRITALDLGWAKYEYVFKSNKVKIDGYYFWNNQKINYTSEPLKSYNPGNTGVPGMLMTKTSGYHIYQTEDSASTQAGCGTYIVTQMKGADLKILHRINACSFSIVPAPDGSKITVKYKDTPNGSMKEMVLY